MQGEDKGQVSFEDTQRAYAYKNSAGLRLASLMFSVLQNSLLSSLGRWMLKLVVQLRLPVHGLIKATLFKQFIGGESISETQQLAHRLGQSSCHSILDYSLEGIESESEFDAAVEEFMKNVEAAAGDKNIPFSVFKPSAIARHHILEKVGAGAALSPSEAEEFEKVRSRFLTIFTKAAELEVRVMVDAEESWIQDAIDGLTLEMMGRFNKDKVIALNTFQMYRHDRSAAIQKLYRQAIDQGFMVGAKLVRGAYMEKERERAAEMGYPSPIQPNKESTDRDYNRGVKLCLENIDRTVLFIGTHNEDSCSMAVKQLEDMAIARDDERVWFCQLYGMCDHITFNLAVAGYNVAKYVPYGPVKAVIPYLIRRADENSSVGGQAQRELKLIKQELRRRKEYA